MLRFMLLGLMLVGCGKDEAEPEQPGPSVKQQYEDISFIIPGDQLGLLPEETQAILKDTSWVKTEAIEAGTPDIRCEGNWGARTQYTFKWKEYAGDTESYYWTGTAFNIAGQFIETCKVVGTDEAELSCRFLDCEKF